MNTDVVFPKEVLGLIKKVLLPFEVYSQEIAIIFHDFFF